MNVSSNTYYTNVERYSATGHLETLPSINTKRNHHACSKYLNSAGEKVYMVVGGWTSWGHIDTTETLVEGGNAWTLHPASLPEVETLPDLIESTEIFQLK